MLGQRIRVRRKQVGWSQRELGARLGVSASTIGMYEQDRREPSLEKLLALASALDTTVDRLLLGEPDLTGAEFADASGVRRPAAPEDVALLAAALPDTDRLMMQRALELAAEAAAEGEVPVGCVIARGTEIVGEGRNRREQSRNALTHAELEAIDSACQRLGGWRLWQCTLYVTLEPCPMCAGAIINARIPRVVYGAKDPKAGSCGSVCDLFCMAYNHHPQAESGLMEEDCAEVLRGFFRQLREKRKAARTGRSQPDADR